VTREGAGTPFAPPRAAALLLLGALAIVRGMAPADAFEPSINYQLHCQGCHLADGRATPGLVPAIDPTLGRMMRVPEGRAYLVRLPNVAAAQIDAADTAALLNWLLAQFAARELPAGFRPITADEVLAGRAAPLVDVAGARADVLRRVDGSSP
jgi:mono/diheme cytochrome c family protein